jgi:hypothetical protein
MVYRQQGKEKRSGKKKFGDKKYFYKAGLRLVLHKVI